MPLQKVFNTQCFIIALLAGSLTGLADDDNNVFDIERIRFVDENHHTQNLLFEGDIPRDEKGEYSRSLLLRGLKKQYGGAFPRKYYLVIISLLAAENPIEANFLMKLYNYFSSSSITDPRLVPYQAEVRYRNGDLWYWWPMRGFVKSFPPWPDDVSWNTLYDAYDNLTAQQVRAKLVNQQFNQRSLNYPLLIDLIARLMETSGNQPYIIYCHSRRGANRNTIAISGYLMKAHDFSVEEAWDASCPSKDSPVSVYEPAEAKSFLFYYKKYLELF